MKYTILLNYDENIKLIEEKEKFKFLQNLLEKMGVPFEDFGIINETLSLEQRVKLRNILTNYNIQVIDNSEEYKIYVEKEKVAEWFKPLYKLKRDLSQLNPKKQLYLEMICEVWSLFEL